MRWISARSCWVAAISCALGSACGGSNKDVSGAYKLSFYDASGLLYLVRIPDDEYLGVLDGRECTVSRGDDSLFLSRCDLIGSGYDGYHASPVYKTIKLERDDAGDLATLSAYEVSDDKVVRGKLSRSKHEPMLLYGEQIESSPPSRVRPQLPWEKLTLEFGAGVLIDEQTLAEAIDVEASSGNEVSAHWTYRSIAVPDSSRRLALSAFATINWQDLMGQSVTFTLPAGTPDSIGKTMSSSMEVAIQVPRIAPAARAWDFDDEAELAGLITWGRHELVRETAECPGSCLQMGRRFDACSEPGVVGLLDTREASMLVVRVRTSNGLSTPLELGIFLGEDENRFSSRQLLADKDAEGDTDFHDIEVPLSAAERHESVPFELRPLYLCPWSWGAEQNRGPSADVTVLIDRIAAE